MGGLALSRLDRKLAKLNISNPTSFKGGELSMCFINCYIKTLHLPLLMMESSFPSFHPSETFFLSKSWNIEGREGCSFVK